MGADSQQVSGGPIPDRIVCQVCDFGVGWPDRRHDGQFQIDKCN